MWLFNHSRKAKWDYLDPAQEAAGEYIPFRPWDVYEFLTGRTIPGLRGRIVGMPTELQEERRRKLVYAHRAACCILA